MKGRRTSVLALVISKILKKFFSITRTIFLTVGQNNFGNKIPFPHPFFPVLGMTSDGDNVTEVISEPDLSKCGVNYCPAVTVDNSG